MTEQQDKKRKSLVIDETWKISTLKHNGGSKGSGVYGRCTPTLVS